MIEVNQAPIHIYQKTTVKNLLHIVSQHPENRSMLKKLPLLKDLFTDPSVSICVRHCSPQWWYSERGGLNLRGFNPGTNQVMIVDGSAFSKWLNNGRFDHLREYNTYDFLVEELFSVMHDYLHIWAYQFIQSEFPEFGFGLDKITSKNIEDFIFLHLVTEVVAALGTDYWFLSQTRIEDTLQCGTVFSTSASRYHFSQDKEFHRLGIFPNKKEFFDDFLSIVCNGQLEKAKMSDFHLSAGFSLWVKHALGYAVNQRDYTSTWFRLMSSNLSPNVHVDKIPYRDKVRKKVANRLKEALYEKLRGKSQFQKPVVWNWDYNLNHGLDFRFLNFNSLRAEMKPAEWIRFLNKSNIIGDTRYLLAQLLAALDQPGKKRSYLQPVLNDNRLHFDPKNVQVFSKENDWKSVLTAEPRSIFLAN